MMLPHASDTNRFRLPVVCFALLVLTCCAAAGCRQTSRQASSPTLLEPAYAEPTSAPNYELTPVPSDAGAPPLPPAEDLVIPPPPGTTQVPAGREDQIGGFTLPPNFQDEPRLPIPASETEDLSALPILPTGSDEESSADGSEVDVFADQIFERTTETVAVPMRDFLRKPAAQPVELDSSLFLLELQADALGETLPIEQDAAVAIEELPVEIEVPLPATTPRSLVVVDDIPQPDHGTSAQPWPKTGVPLDIVITPGPVAPKWSRYDSYRNYAAPPAALPRRLANSNSDWELRPIE